jgi:hypothetical protein
MFASQLSNRIIAVRITLPIALRQEHKLKEFETSFSKKK